MRFGKAGACVAAALVVLAGVGAAANSASATRTPAPERVTALRQAALDGSLQRTHPSINACTATVDGRTYQLGCDRTVVASAQDPSKPLITATPAGLGPADLARAFDIPSGGRAGTVGILTIADNPKLESDLATYRAQYGLPPCTIANGCLTVVDTNGGPRPAPTANLPGLNNIAEVDAGETELDAQMVSAACPACNIVVVEQPINLIALGEMELGYPEAVASGFATAANTAIRLGATAVTDSIILYNGNQATALTSGAIAEGMHHPGVAMVAISGDHGYRGVQPGNQEWPAELPWVTSVGGVSLSSTDGGATFTPTAWSGTYSGQGYMSSGSGCATMLPSANGQPASVAALCGGHRAMADVSAAAANLAFYDTYLPYSGGAGGWSVNGGTSAASPYIAGLYARAGVAGVDGPNTIYQAPSGAIQNVTTGSNTQNGAAGCTGAPAALCVAGPGWNGPTGLGVPHGLAAF